MKFYAQTMPGVEDIAWLEIKERLPRVRFVEKLFAKEKNGLVIFDYEEDAQDLLKLRTAEDLFLLALSLDKVTRGWKDLYRLTDTVMRSAEFKKAVDAFMLYQQARGMSGKVSFRVISRLYGRHEYRRIDLERSIVKGVKARYPHWQHVGDHARVEIWVNLLGSQLICGLRLSDKTMRHRFKKEKKMRAELRPSVAAAMVHLSQPEPGDVFLDPMCGSGTILMERRMAGAYGQLLGGDIDPERVLATRNNVVRMRKERPSHFQLHHLNARKLPFATESVDKIASNLPFGKQIGSPRLIKRLYPAFFKEVARVLKPNGRA
ncbi:MAG: methyltransferase domain-containing protein, partial [Chloroflexi bacterium]|nr:methyltransferase domain-containing protein [Chloroflexota bacterium]